MKEIFFLKKDFKKMKNIQNLEIFKNIRGELKD